MVLIRDFVLTLRIQGGTCARLRMPVPPKSEFHVEPSKKYMTIENKLVAAIVDGIKEKKGEKIVIADLTAIETAPCAYFVIGQGNSPQQVEAITDSVEEQARLQAAEKPAAVAGLENAEWVAMDYGDVIVHVFLPEARQFYDLEHLWEDAMLTELPDEA